MPNLSRAINFAKEFNTKHPEHKEQVQDYFELMQDEIAEGGSVDNEIHNFIQACEDLLSDSN